MEFPEESFDVILSSLAIAKDKKNDTKIFIAELNYDLLKTKFKEEITYTPESTFAKTSRDIAMIVDKKVECGDIIAAIEKADKLVSGVDLFDIFESEKLGFGKKSMAFRIVFASHEFPSLHNVCVMVTLNDHSIFDFEDYMRQLSEAIFPEPTGLST